MAQEDFGISPDEYAALLRSVQLREVILDRVNAACDRKKLTRSTATVRLEATSSFEMEAGISHALIHYDLAILQGKAEVVKVSADYRVTLVTPQPLPEAFFKVFQHFNLRASTTPYLRELVASLTGRMELPTLTLPYEILGSSEPATENDGEDTIIAKKTLRKRKKTDDTNS